MMATQPITERAARVRSGQGRMQESALLRGRGGGRPSVQTMARAAMVQAHEAALLLSVAATAPVRLFRDGPEADNALPQADPHAAPTHPVLLVHGFGGAKSSWSLVAQALTAQGLAVDAMSYAPVGSSVERLADNLVVEVERTLSRTGANKVHLVGHSLGGVIIAQAILDSRLTGRVDTVITLGSPFGGSPWAGALPFVEIVRALRRGSPLLRRLACAPLPDGVRWLSVTAALDVVVPGMRSVPFHPQVENVTIDGVGHLGMLLSRRVIDFISCALGADESDTGAEPAMRRLPTAS